MTSIPASMKVADQTPTAAALHYHLHDFLDADTDTIGHVDGPHAVRLGHPSLMGGKFPAFRLRAEVVVGGKASGGDVVQTTITMLHLLLVRMEAFGTDLCVWVSVVGRGEGRQHRGVEGGGEGDGEKEVESEEEEVFAESIVEELLAGLEVRDWGLFGRG